MLRKKGVHWDFHFKVDAFHGVSDEPSPPLRVRCEVSFYSLNPVGVATLPLQSTRFTSKLAYCFKNR